MLATGTCANARLAAIATVNDAANRTILLLNSRDDLPKSSSGLHSQIVLKAQRALAAEFRSTSHANLRRGFLKK
jgi:hypothetical protein